MACLDLYFRKITYVSMVGWLVVQKGLHLEAKNQPSETLPGFQALDKEGLKKKAVTEEMNSSGDQLCPEVTYNTIDFNETVQVVSET